tara:strand:- start:424 stop:777 length:354 start_codon:yes stop_codon:yes gene_type:complete
MTYISGFVAAVPEENKEKFIAHSKICTSIFKEYGAEKVVDCWEDDVPEGDVTSFPMAVQRKDGEKIVFSWITWPSKEVCEQGMQKVMEDPRMTNEENPMPFDGKRLIYGGFQVINEE